MGLNIKDIVPKKEIEISDLKGNVVCVDAFNTLYQFLSTIRQYDGTPLMDSKKRITSHLSGLFYRNIKLLEEGIKLVYVFDGKPPELKSKIHAKRQKVRGDAKEKLKIAKQSEDFDVMKRYSSQLVRLDDEMIEESKELLEALGIAVIQAPSEGESEAAFLVKENDAYAVSSQDYDSLLFASPRLIQNLTLARKRKTFSGWKEVKPELIELDKLLKELEINQEQLICLGILIGTDYNPKGIPGIGQKKALKLVKEKEKPEDIFKDVEEKISELDEEDQFDWKEIFELFMKPKVRSEDFKFPQIDEEKIRDILVDRHEFSEERVDKQIERLEKIKDEQKQKGLDKWF